MVWRAAVNRGSHGRNARKAASPSDALPSPSERPSQGRADDGRREKLAGAAVEPKLPS